MHNVMMPITPSIPSVCLVGESISSSVMGGGGAGGLAFFFFFLGEATGAAGCSGSDDAVVWVGSWGPSALDMPASGSNLPGFPQPAPPATDRGGCRDRL